MRFNDSIKSHLRIETVLSLTFHHTVCVCYLLLVVEMHLTVSHLPPQPVHFLAELQLVLPLIRRFIQLFRQVEVLAVQFSIFLTQLCELLLQVCDHLRTHRQVLAVPGWRQMDIFRVKDTRENAY